MLYRGTLNAALNVKRTELPIKSWNDVLASQKDLLVWEGSSAPASLKHSSDLTHQKVYHEKVLQTPTERNLHVIGYNRARDEIMNGNAIVYTHSTPLLIMPEYPCGIVDIPTLT